MPLGADLVIVDETLDGLVKRFKTWKTEMEAKGLRVNMDKSKIMISGPNLHTLKDTGKFPCAVCRTGLGNNSIYCSSCSHWVHKKCSGIKGKLHPDVNFKCSRCSGSARPIDARPFEQLEVDGEELQVVDSFCYLGDSLSAGGGCEVSSITRIRAAWGKFRELLPILTSRSLSLLKRGEVYSCCVRSTMLYGSETWAQTRETLQRMQRNDRTMIRWICGVRLSDRIHSDALLAKLNILSIEDLLRRRRLRWFGHVQRSDGWIKKCTNIVIDGPASRGRPKKTWKETIADDRKRWKMNNIDPGDRVTWRNRLRTAVTRPHPL